MTEADLLRHALRQVLDRDQGRIAAALAIEPEDHATSSRDYGRGFAEAIRLVREALA